MMNRRWVWIAAAVGVGFAFLAARLTLSEKRPSDDRPPPVPVAADDPAMPTFGQGFVDDGGYNLAFDFTAPIDNRADLAEVYAACAGRYERGRLHFEGLLAKVAASDLPPERKSALAATYRMQTGILAMYEADFAEADRLFTRAVEENPGIAPKLRDNIAVLRGVAWLRRGELDNCVACVGPSSCILPIAPEAVHTRPMGSTKAIEHFSEYLDKHPEDIGVRWLLNVAHMTLGSYPDGLPADRRIPLDRFRSKLDFGRFVNVAGRLGLDSRGPNMSGGSIFDDFDGDGRPDVFVISTDWTISASLFINKGDGTFEDQGSAWGLDGQKMALNAAHADYDNDGDLDLVLLRGGWEKPYRMTLLRNEGGKRFQDVTVAAKLDAPIASQVGAWGDYDGDGRLDLFVGGEFHTSEFEPLNRCRLYHNDGDGTFTDVAASAGVENDRWTKGASWGDYDGDGDVDLYVSNMNDANRLYRNEGGGKFVDVAPELGLVDPLRSFACWFWDYDDDGDLDLFVAGFGAWIGDVAADLVGEKTDADRPRLYRNDGGKFVDATKAAGLDRVWLPMGCNFADVDEDGHLDIYLGTGRPPYSHLVPNVMLKNVGGKTFEDVTKSSGTGHLQKGHGVSFADWDDDGDVDLLVEAGGTTPGDRAYNLLFQNPGHGRRWLKVKLVGTKTNRSAIGARITAEFDDPESGPRRVFRTINGGSSFGGNALVASIGLGKAATVRRITVDWPVGRSRQVFENLESNQLVEITEGGSTYRSVRPRPIPLPKREEP